MGKMTGANFPAWSPAFLKQSAKTKGPVRTGPFDSGA
jgi:hypothetical protein